MAGNFTSIEGLGKPVMPSEVNPSVTVSSGENNTMRELVEHRVEAFPDDAIEATRDTIDVPPELREIGVESTGASDFNTEKPLVLSLTDEQIFKEQKGPVTSSTSWLANFYIRHLKKLKVVLKLIHGHVMRVVSSSS